jgi:hypothetical protein
MIVDVIQRRKFIKIQRTRSLPYPGRVIVGEGDTVHPEDIIAEAVTPANLQIVDIARGLGVSVSAAKAHLIRQPGESLDEGDVIAQLEGRLPLLMRTPVKGLFLEFFDGKAVIATGSSKVRLKAGMSGVVETVIPEMGVAITVKGSLLQGVWGNGKVGEGNLKVLDTTEDNSSLDAIGEDIEPGQVFAAGTCMEEMTLVNLVNAGASGLIFSAIAPSLLPLAEALPIPVILLQGFGDLKTDPETLSILQSREGARTTVIANQPKCLQRQRPEVIISGGDGEPGKEMNYREKIDLGHRVLVVSGQAAGQFGDVTAFLEQERYYESGITDLTAEIRTPDGQIIQVPCSNLVILGHSI